MRAVIAIVLCAAAPTWAQTTSRVEMESRARQYLDIQLQTSQEDTCLLRNLQRSEYATSSCNGASADQRHSSDFLWHPDYLNGGPPRSFGWWGMPYAYGSGHAPNQGVVQGKIDGCVGLGNHSCHYTGNGCQYPGCTWSVGVDCSGAVSYAWGIAYVGTATLPSAEYSREIPRSSLRKGSILNWPDHHVVLVVAFNGQDVSLLEATSDYPVYRSRSSVRLDAFPENEYTALDSKNVVDDQGSDGILAAVARPDGSVQLSWSVESGRGARFYGFQFLDPVAEVWRTMRAADFAGPGTYEATYDPDVAGDGSRLVFRVLETEWSDAGGGTIPHGETHATPMKR